MSELKSNKISPAIGTDVTLGDSGDTFTIPSGATIVNNGTATGFGGITKSASDPTASTNPAGGVGTVFLNTTSGEMFSLTDATAGANIWTNTGEGTGNISRYIEATGGTVTTDGNFKVHTFTTSGDFIVTLTGTSGTTMKVLAVAGGGGGGGPVRAAGGGAGGLLYNLAISPTVGTQTVTIGAGGNSGPNVGTTNNAATGSNGTNTVFQTLTSIGGGGGGAADGVRDGGSGGSGGGCWLINGVPGAGTAGQGFVGGQGVNVAHPYYGGGGGGAGEAGRAANDATRPEGGGNGLEIDITGTATYYAGGGSASNYNQDSNPPSVGGLGGGGVGKGAASTVVGQAPSNGGANLGGGGGASGNGGSGVVIIRYQFQA